MADDVGRPERLCLIEGTTRKGAEFAAAAVWVRGDDGAWRCVEAAPIIAWMVGRDPEAIRRYMIGMGWTWRWADPMTPEQAAAAVGVRRMFG